MYPSISLMCVAVAEAAKGSEAVFYFGFCLKNLCKENLHVHTQETGNLIL